VQYRDRKRKPGNSIETPVAIAVLSGTPIGREPRRRSSGTIQQESPRQCPAGYHSRSEHCTRQPYSVAAATDSTIASSCSLSHCLPQSHRGTTNRPPRSNYQRQKNHRPTGNGVGSGNFTDCQVSPNWIHQRF